MLEHNAIINEEQNDLKKRATRRLIVAVSLVLAAVAILTVLSKQKPSRPVAQELPSTTVQLTPQPAVEPPPAIETSPAPAPEPESKPVETPSAAAPASPPETPPPPQVSAQPEIQHSQPASTSQKRPAQPQPALTIESAQKTAIPHAEKPVPAPAPKTQTVTTGPKTFVLQLGVFSNPANAIQLQEKLAQHGIQSYTETRVHVGPFKDKAEADKAMEKIRTLGIGAVVVQH
ncbi:SPOR domain-containing protein [Sulfurirhabdus autotrophica]|uniref:DedD protein n=1 Tax=Sulfurirhabdus autotrophica TaxID=1706046 RepID=A0A4R3Y9S7_9PROT|nr:SPOR domain-containing protein [Sulfurirhabdus autotrophica]TCV87404.1 DedD protein [Sulfurirhabdus autotrophica]